MLQSQFTANAQHPDKYAGQEFESRKVTHMPLDGSPLTLEEIRFLETVAFQFPQLAEKYRVHEVISSAPVKQSQGLISEKNMVPSRVSTERTNKKAERRKGVYEFLKGRDWTMVSEVAAQFTVIKSTASADLKALLDDGLLETNLEPMKGQGGICRLYRRADCDTSPH